MDDLSLEDFFPTDEDVLRTARPLLEFTLDLMAREGWLPPYKMHWAAPAAAGTTPRRLEDRLILRQLQENPGRWARVAEGVHETARDAWLRRGCEAVARRNWESDRWDIYARWPEAGDGDELDDLG